MRSSCRINAAAAGFWDALADDLDTPTALGEAAALAARFSGLQSSGQPIPPLALARAAATLEHALGTLGLDYAAGPPSAARATTDPASPALDGRPTVDTVVGVLADFRSRVASVARPLMTTPDGHAPPSVARALLAECDHLRDRILPPLHIELQDAADGGARWQWTAAAADDADASVAAAKNAQRAKAAAIETRRQLAPSEFFRAQTELYSAWDAEVRPTSVPLRSRVGRSVLGGSLPGPRRAAFVLQGLPTHDAQGQPLSATQRKRLAKKLAKHAAAWQAEPHASGP